MLKTRRLWFLALTLAILSAPCRGQVSSSTQQFARVYRAAQIEMDLLRCGSIACADLKTRILNLGSQFEAGVNSDVLYPELVSDLTALQDVLQRNNGVEYERYFALGKKLFQQSKLQGGLQPQDSGAEEQCKIGCDRAFAATALLCTLLPPPFDGFCGAADVASYLGCLADCSIGGGQARTTTLPETQTLLPPEFTDANLDNGIPKLALHYSSTDLQAAMATARSLLGAKQ